jgi:putative NIF3 family GTP cyclohydrolase 1 type 2
VPSTADLVALLDRLLGPGSQELRAHPRVDRLVLALDPPPPADIEQADAVLLHRSHGFDPPPGVGVVACHDPFDRALGLAHNGFLHADLGLCEPEILEPKVTLHRAPTDIAQRIVDAFGGREGQHLGDGHRIRRVALADAMTERTVERAVGLGADLYVTGTWRVPGAAVVDRSGIGVLVVGHARQERASLARLAGLIVQQGFTADVRMR